MPKRRKDKDGNEILTVKEMLFVEGVAQGNSFTQAALDAGYSPANAAHIGKQNARKLPIQQAVQNRIQGVVQADTDEVLQLFASHLRGDVADFQDLFLEDGRLDLNAARDRGISRLIKKLDYIPVGLETVDSDGAKILVTRYRCKIEFHDSQAAARQLADILGIKQAPRENAHDVEARRREKDEDIQKARALLAEYIEKVGDEATARAMFAEDAPLLSELIN